MFEEAATAGSALSRQVSQYRPILDQLRKIYENSPPPLVITCARGSSDHAATYLRYLFETRAGILTTSLAPSVASLYGKWPHIAGALCVAISQSGKSTPV
jgi:glutamine---fructose-6-phosphate transaminase (isomerizing)